jgi:nucleoside-diphosphate-sugar epimerase
MHVNRDDPSSPCEEDMNVLVTGHLGYIGVEMVPALRAAGHDVVGLDIGLYDGCDFRARPDDVPTLNVDLRDVTPGDLRGCEAVVHLAALSNDPLGDLDAALTYDINHGGSVRLAEAAKEAGVRRFLFSSSCSLYGAGEGALLDENAAFHPVTPYGESKVLVEQELARLASASFSPVYLRNATAYGVSRRLRGDIVVNNLVGHAYTTGKVLVQSDGTPWRPLVHLRDIVDAFIACLRAPIDAVHDQAFNVGRSSENFQIRQVASLVAEVVPGCEVAFAPGASPDARNYRVDFRKIETRLPGYEPRWTLRQGIEELYHAYRTAGLTREAFEGPRYFRLRTVRGLQERGLLDGKLRPRGAAGDGAHGLRARFPPMA